MSCHQMIQINVKKEEHKRRILEYVRWLVQETKLNQESGIRFRPYPEPFKLDIEVRREVLVSKVNIIEKELPDRKSLARHLVCRAVIALKKQELENPSWEDFRRELNNAAKAHVDRPLIDYRILLPFHISGSWIDSKPWIDVLGMSFQRVTWPEVEALPGWEQFLRDAQHVHLLPDRQDDLTAYLTSVWGFTPLLVDVPGRMHQDAFDSANRNFDLLRALVNYVSRHIQRGFVYFGTSKPLGVSLPPPVYGMFWPDGYYKLYRTVERYDYKAKEFEQDSGRQVEELLNRIASISGEMQSLMINVLLRYGEAMDTANWRYAFLSLWQVLEAVSLQSKTAKRVGVLIEANPLYTDLIDVLAQSRNLFAHQGEFSEEGLREVNFLKIIADLAIDAFFDYAERFPDRKSLKGFYKHATKHNC